MNKSDPRGYYTALGVSPSANAAEIKAAFRSKAMALHPDRNPSPEATRQFQHLNEAYGILSDPVARAQYDTITIEIGSHGSKQTTEEPSEPIVCSSCRKISAQPRYAIFFEVKSFIFQTIRTPIQGIFCSSCAEKKALKATAITWILGWWGFPWGIVYSIHAIFNNLMGGTQPANINAHLAAYQAWVFTTRGNTNLARAIALDALTLAKKIKPNYSARTKNSRSYEVQDEGKELRQQIEPLLERLGNGSGSRLKDTWRLFRRPFYVQTAMGIAIVGAVSLWLHSEPSNTTLAITPHPSVQPKPKYVRPLTAPNGEAWPNASSYVKGYPQLHKNGYSKCTVDNTQNDSDVFCKLISLNEAPSLRVRAFYIPAHSKFTVNSITPGNYDLRHLDLNSGHLSRSESFSLEETHTHEGVRYSTMTMTLYKVMNGNMKSYEISEDEF